MEAREIREEEKENWKDNGSNRGLKWKRSFFNSKAMGYERVSIWFGCLQKSVKH